MGSAADVHAGVVIRRLDPINLRDFHERDLSRVLDGLALHCSGNISALSDPLLGAPQSSVKAIVIKRLQQVVEGPGLESPHRVLIVSRDKDYGGRQISAEQFKHVEAVATRPLNIQEE